jgi:hypothetical protein
MVLVASLLFIIALVLFVLTACGVQIGKVHFGWLGLAFFVAGHLWPHFVKVSGG